MSKINLEELSIRNFSSFGDSPQVFKFPNNGVYRIVGKNLDITPETIGLNNLQIGTGKSSFLSALCFAITGDVPKKISKDSLINKKTKKNLHLSLTFKKNNDRYKIDRYRRHSKYSNRLLLFKEESGQWNDITLEDLSFTQEYINKIFGINFDVLLKTTILARDGSRNFLDLPTHERTQVIENIVQLDKLKEYSQKIKDKLRESRKQLEYANLDLSECSGSVKTLKQLIEQEISDKKKNKKQLLARIDSINKTLKKENINYVITKEFLNEVDKIRDREKTINALEKEHKKAYVKTDPESLHYLYEKYRSWKKVYLEEVTELGALKNSKGEICPHCFKELNEKKRLEKIKTKEINNLKDRKLLSERINNFRKRVKRYREDYLRFFLEVEKHKNLISDFNKKFSPSYEDWINKIEKSYNEFSHLHEEIEEKKNELKTNLLLTNIFSMRKKLKEKRVVWLDLLSKKKVIEDQISIGEYWDAAFDFRNEGSIKSYIINKIIPVFNSILSNFISIMFDGQMNISFDSSFEESIVYGGEIYDYNQLSTGEKGKLNLCIAFTILNITRMNLVSINCMFLDEIFAGMDPSTIKKFIDIIRKSYSKQLAVFVVGYEAGVDEFLNPDSVITIKKENSESYLD